MNTSSMNRFFVRTYFVFKRFMARLFEKPKFILEAADTLMFKKRKIKIFSFIPSELYYVYFCILDDDVIWVPFARNLRRITSATCRCNIYLNEYRKILHKNMDRLKLWLLYRENITSDPCCTCFGSAYTKYT